MTTIQMTAEEMLGKRLIVYVSPFDKDIDEPFEVTVDEIESTTQLVRVPKIQFGVYKWVRACDIVVLAELEPPRPVVDNAFMRKFIADALAKDNWSDVTIPRNIAIHAVANCFK